MGLKADLMWPDPRVDLGMILESVEPIATLAAHLTPETRPHPHRMLPGRSVLPVGGRRPVPASLVLLQCAPLAKRFLAQGTAVRSLARVDTFMNAEIVATAETFRAFAARKVLDGLVDFLMGVKTWETDKWFGARGTAVLLLWDSFFLFLIRKFFLFLFLLSSFLINIFIFFFVPLQLLRKGFFHNIPLKTTQYNSVPTFLNFIINNLIIVRNLLTVYLQLNQKFL